MMKTEETQWYAKIKKGVKYNHERQKHKSVKDHYRSDQETNIG